MLRKSSSTCWKTMRRDKKTFREETNEEEWRNDWWCDTFSLLSACNMTAWLFDCWMLTVVVSDPFHCLSFLPACPVSLFGLSCCFFSLSICLSSVFPSITLPLLARMQLSPWPSGCYWHSLRPVLMHKYIDACMAFWPYFTEPENHSTKMEWNVGLWFSASL